MKIIVCIKQVPDHQAPRDSYVVNSKENRVEPRGIPPVLSDYDERALEAALKIRDALGTDVGITVLTLGKRISRPVMLKALAAGADDLVKVEDPIFDEESTDTYIKATFLAAAVRKIGQYDLLLLGRQSSDWNSGQTAFVLAALLKIPIITLAKQIAIVGNTLRVARALQHGWEVAESRLPAVVMVTNEMGELRYPTVIQRKNANAKPVLSWNSRDLSLPEPGERKIVVAAVAASQVRQRQCRFIEGATPQEAGERLAALLAAYKIVQQ
jgi:electron transfer flavoprotein beta subunit